MHILHHWEYLDQEHRICSQCGECQLFYDASWFWQYENRFTEKESNLTELEDRYWKPCLADELESHMEIRRKELEQRKKEKRPDWKSQEKSRKEREKEAAFTLLKAYGFKQKVPTCRKCGAEIVAGASFCTNCGKDLRKRLVYI